jgi:thioredoxin-like negative regulator of GroEL
MLTRRTVFTGLFALLAFSVLGFCLETSYAAQPFDQAKFDAAQKEGKAILVEVTAPWCPTCRAQKPTLQSIESERPDLIVFDVDFDTKKDVLQRFGVRAQSTLIVFRGTKEISRSTGVTDPSQIRAQIAAAF